jgi:hypothetical protein
MQLKQRKGELFLQTLTFTLVEKKAIRNALHWLGIFLLYTVTDQNIAFLVPVEQQKGTVTVKAMTTHMTPLKTLRMTFVSAIFNWNMVEPNSFITDSKFKWASGQKKNQQICNIPAIKMSFHSSINHWIYVSIYLFRNVKM